MIAFLVALILICLAWWAIAQIMSGFCIPAPIQKVVTVIFVFVVVLWLLSALGVGPALPRFFR